MQPCPIQGLDAPGRGGHVHVLHDGLAEASSMGGGGLGGGVGWVGG